MPIVSPRDEDSDSDEDSEDEDEQEEEEEDSQSDFIASKKFSGVKAGYVFTTGDQGVGYYKDAAVEKTKEVDRFVGKNWFFNQSFVVVLRDV